ncbi:pyridoxamine 5'-phosphate oxidase [Anaerosporomusa subterranea]|uniref:Pyridoxamine 5'-phosphate oxidase n=1 Tax=Anaerosporomusa subterranea TaxID=1794912 RepID=A0A154BNA2_ANASB|nr:pyridoxamine 5'-phosphate oxidase family protein [Anaerosporomusa subterranea]KYZ75330.1 pyridoxamine 5'-phosphate oxidase [Anaerosporomusa subterranea]
MKDVIDFLNANPLGFLATIEDGNPRVRPWGFMLERDSRLWFCTANNKSVFHQLRKNPSIEFSSMTQKFAFVRVSGEAKFSKDIEMKRYILENRPMIKEIYKTPDNPIFEIFYLEHGKAVLSDMSGQPAKAFEF